MKSGPALDQQAELHQMQSQGHAYEISLSGRSFWFFAKLLTL
jgi:hypothetical protein